MRKPDSNKPKLNNGATALWPECPRSLKAFVPQLNHGDHRMDKAMKTIAMIGAIRPSRA